MRALLDALELRYPMLRGTLRDSETLQRRPFMRYFACGEDISFAPDELALPEAVVNGSEPVTILGAIAGGKEGSG